MKAQRHYYGERMTTCIGRAQEEEIQEEDEKRVDVRKAGRLERSKDGSDEMLR